MLYLWAYWATFIILTIVSSYKISEYNELQKNSILTLNKLMESENDMFECYFEMKSIYFYSNFTKEDAEIFYNQTLRKMGVVENEFVKTALDIVELSSEQEVKLA